MADKPQKELGGPRQMSLATKIVIAVFAVIMSLSMMLPSLAQIVAGSQEAQQREAEAEAEQQDASQEEQSDESKDEATNENEAKSEDDAADKGDDAANKDTANDGSAEGDANDPTSTVPENDTLKSLAEQYDKDVEKYEKRLEENPKNLAALYNLGERYSYWGYSALTSSTTDEEKDYSKALITKGADYYDRYLGVKESDAVKVNRALCDLYLGDTEKAAESLKKMSEELPNYPLVWANLGMVYEMQYDYTSAKDAYAKAQKTDPNDEYGAKSYAEQRVAAILSSTSDFSDLTNQDLLGTNSTPAEGLPATLAEHGGV